ncbi:MAG: hypothetical protein ACLUKN_11350 [Bacilli bacterium]
MKLPPNAPRTLSKKNIPLPDRLFSGLIRGCGKSRDKPSKSKRTDGGLA